MWCGKSKSCKLVKKIDFLIWARHHSGIDAMIKHSIRINSWITPRSETYPINLTFHNLRHRRMGVTVHGQYIAWLSITKDILTYDGTS